MKSQGLRSGFTTGTCAAVAAKAAAAMLLTGENTDRAAVETPKGVKAEMEILQPEISSRFAFCAVKKDAGDDPDVTHGMLVCARVEYIEPGEEEEQFYRSDEYDNLYLTGGTGVGVVTRKGLACPVGLSAVNPVPRRMIFHEVGKVCRECGMSKRLLITIELPDGEKLAGKTFNPKLGIVGGISILGTSGVVEPMSEQALIDTVFLEIHMKAVEKCQILVLAPGNYGENFLQKEFSISLERGVKCSNFIGAAIQKAAEEGIRKILLVGHLGKLIKVAGGVENTHSKYGDRRMEILWNCTKDCMRRVEDRKSDKEKWLEQRILGANTTEEAVELLKKTGILEAVMAETAERIREQAVCFAAGKSAVEVVTFSSVYGILGKTGGAEAFAVALRDTDGMLNG